MTDKPEVRITKTLAAMARGAPLAGIERLCESQKTVACSVLARMVDEAQDINTGYALTFKYGHEASRAADKARIAELEAEKARYFIPEGVWHEGCPRHPYGSEWFIAKLDNGQRVVLKELPEEHSYDYRTADETYYSAYRIAAWMQFPDSQYVAALAQQGKEGGE